MSDAGLAQRDDLRVLRADGSVMTHEVFVFVSYFAIAHQAIADLIEPTITDYARLIGFDALSLTYDGEGNPVPLDEATLRREFDLQFRVLAAPNANIILSSDDGFAPHQHYLWYDGKEYPSELFPTEVGYLRWWMPRRFFLDRRDAVLRHIDRFVAGVPFSSAYASLGLAESGRQQMQALAKRHPGLDIAHPGCVSSDLDRKSAGVYWLNFFGPELAAAAGGLSAVRGALPETAGVAELPDGGLAVRLGDHPEIGDVNRRDDLPAYRALARHLDRRGLLHVPQRVAYFKDAQGLADREAQAAWHRRFVDE